MKKLNKKQRQNIKAGWSITGALFTGIGNIVKACFDGVTNLIGTIGGLALANREFDKSHVKMAVKFGNNAISYDDSAQVKADENIAEERIKAARSMNTASEKHTRLAVEPKPQLVDLTKQHEVIQHHDDLSSMVNDTMHMIDDFMHF